MAVYRIYVERKKEYAAEACDAAAEIRDFLKIPELKILRIINRYDVEGIDRTLFDKCKDTIFSDPQTDLTYDELPKADHTISVEYLPGQYDQRADSCARCIQLLSMGDLPLVRTARIYLLDGLLSQDNLRAIKGYLINPIESRETHPYPFTTLAEDYEEPEDVTVLKGFRNMEGEDLNNFLSEYGLAMDCEDLEFCRDYFRSEDRDPTLTEIRMIDTYWSDHCRHTTFLTHIDSLSINDNRVKEAYKDYLDMRLAAGRGDRPVTLMDIATVGAKYLKKTGVLTTLDESEEVNACSVKVNVNVDGEIQPWLLMFKNETHNHPTEIEPFGGAATCLGGAIRDPLSGRAYVYQAMRITGAADPFTPADATIPGKLPQRKLVRTAARGYSSYGNQIGLAAGLVTEVYHPGYAAKRMEMGAVLAAAPASYVVRDVPKPGDGVILLGGRTGRDGCGGATGSSKSHSISSMEESSAEVQKGNAPEERKIQRLFRKEKVTRLIKRCNDFGAGGVSVAVGELADSLEIDLDAVPAKYGGLDGTELAISESQERMAVVVSQENIDLFIEYAGEENLEASLIARVTDTGRMIMSWRGKVIVDLSREFLNSNGTNKHTKVAVPDQRCGKSAAVGRFSDCFGNFDLKADTPIAEKLSVCFEKLVTDLNFCSQKGLIDGFDSTAGAGTVLMPFGGYHQETPAQVMAAKFPVLNGDTSTCSVMSFGFNPYLLEADQFSGSYFAVIESVAKLVAGGADIDNCWLSFQEFFEKPGDNPLRWGKPFTALLGALSAQKDLSIAAIGGKDSMSGSFENLDVPPTLVSVAVSVCDGDNVISPEFKRSGDPVVLLAPEYKDDGLPARDSLAYCLETVQQLIKDKKVLSAFALTGGGCAEAIFKMSLGNRIGLNFSPDYDLSALFDYNYGAFLLELDGGKLSPSGVSAGVLVGTTIDEYCLKIGEEKIDLGQIRNLYNGKLEPVFPTKVDQEPLIRDGSDSFMEVKAAAEKAVAEKTPSENQSQKSGFTGGRPKVLIPVFPGTCGEYDAAKAVELAGGRPEIMVIRNLTPSDIKDSYSRLAEQIRDSQIIILPGGASCGDEPDGSGKFIANFLENPRVADELKEFLRVRRGLMLGLGNGFQALLKCGLLPYGEISNKTPDLPALTTNTIGRHQSMLIRTRVASTNSPWLMNCKVGDIHTIPLACGEGRFVASAALLNQLLENDQIAAQYVDPAGAPTMDIRFNPTGSAMAIEALTSPDGMILGKMGHSERKGSHLYKNVPGDKEQKLFESAIRYFGF